MFVEKHRFDQGILICCLLKKMLLSYDFHLKLRNVIATLFKIQSTEMYMLIFDLKRLSLRVELKFYRIRICFLFQIENLTCEQRLDIVTLLVTTNYMEVL